MKKIKILAMGGTISAHHEDRTNLKDYVSGYYSGKDLMAEIPEVKNIANIHIEQFTNVSSTLVSSQHWIDLRNEIHYAFEEENHDGIVITHGTNTLEETAYFLHLTVNTKKPIVLTGAQRPLSGLSSDAPLNLLNAVKVASAETSYDKGVLVVLNDQISSARDVTKTNTYRLETFQSGEFGCLGFVDPDNSVQFYRAPLRKHTTHSVFARLDIKSLPTVDIIYSYAGANGRTIRALNATDDTRGIVMAGTGAGRCSFEEEEALRESREKGIHVVMGSRVENGRVVPIDYYGFLNAVTSDNLSPQKARILLMVALLKYDKSSELQEVFSQY